MQSQNTLRTQLSAHWELMRRYLFTVACGLWLGGFTFYSTVVIHTGHRVLGGLLAVGFVTQRVTYWLNLIGVVTLLILLWNVIAMWRGPCINMRWALAVTWLIMAAVQVSLFVLHLALDIVLNADTHQILDRSRFRSLHNAYLTVSTVQWAAGLLHVWFALAVWRRFDAGLSEAPVQADSKNAQPVV
jgi:hypothetical protein